MREPDRQSKSHSIRKYYKNRDAKCVPIVFVLRVFGVFGSVCRSLRYRRLQRVKHLQDIEQAHSIADFGA